MGMETPETLHQRVRREQQMLVRLRLAMTRLADAEQERIWSIVAAKEAGLSIRQIARATGMSPTRVHQLLQSDEAREIPVWLSQLHDHRLATAGESAGAPPAPSPLSQTCLADEAEALRWCITWLERLELTDHVVVNLRPAEAEATEFVPFDRPRVLRVLTRIAADLDALSRSTLAPATAAAKPQETPEARHRRRLAEPEPPPRRLSRQEERAAVRQAAGLPPYTRR
jgi:transcriptional regulator with XRE-family HTH domain